MGEREIFSMRLSSVLVLRKNSCTRQYTTASGGTRARNRPGEGVSGCKGERGWEVRVKGSGGGEGYEGRRDKS